MTDQPEYIAQNEAGFVPPTHNAHKGANAFKRAMHLAFPWRYGYHYPGCLESVALALRIPTGTASVNAYNKRGPSANMCLKLANWLEVEVSYYQAMIYELRTYAADKTRRTEMRPGVQALRRHQMKKYAEKQK